MKIQLDTTAKTIKVEQAVNFGELVEVLDKMLPDGEWKTYKLEANTVIQNWGNPIIIRERAYPPSWPWRPTPYFGDVYCGTSSGNQLSGAVGGVAWNQSSVTNVNKPQLGAGFANTVFNIEA